MNNKSTKDKTITRVNWIKYLNKENIEFTAEETDKLFDWIDIKKDGIIDKEEFLSRYHHTLKPLSTIQNIILQNQLDIEDLAHHMNINISKSEKDNMDYNTFRDKIKTLNYTYPDSFIKNLYNDLTSDNKEKNAMVNSKKFLDEINYIKPVENYKSFIQNYMDKVRQRTNHDELKSNFEKYDKNNTGTLTKIDYIYVMNKIVCEYEDIDHMRFIRVTDMFDNFKILNILTF